MITCSAPGKLFLFGEYAVLAGGWSVVTAVDRRVRATRRDEPGDYRVEGADFEDAFPRAVLDELSEAIADRWSTGHFETDVRELYEDGQKLGLGSSAASAVALTAAALLDEEDDVDDHRGEIFQHAEAAHRAFQGGRGSGAGLAAASWGGLLGYRRHGSVEPFPELLGPASRSDAETVGEFAIEEMAYPEDLELGAVWLGESAKTTDFIGQVEWALQHRDRETLGTLQSIANKAEDALAALDRGDADALVDLVESADKSMGRLGEVAEIPIVTDTHRQLRNVAHHHGAAVKPSGAGGGEFSWVASTSSIDWDDLLAELPSECRHWELTLGAEGASVENKAST
jgi:ERG8-type phosphomevalonate kinase